jgi:hypothetical protein
MAVGDITTGHPAARLASPRALGRACPTPYGAGAAGQPRRGGDRPGHGCLHLGHRPRSIYRALASTRRQAQTSGREAAPVWRHPRRHEAAARNPRASSRPVPDGRQSGGRQPTDSRVLNRRADGCLLCPWSREQSGENNAQRPSLLWRTQSPLTPEVIATVWR